MESAWPEERFVRRPVARAEWGVLSSQVAFQECALLATCSISASFERFNYLFVFCSGPNYADVLVRIVYTNKMFFWVALFPITIVEALEYFGGSHVKEQ